MIFDFFKILFTSKKPEPIPPQEEELLGSVVAMPLTESPIKNAGVNPLPTKPKPNIKPLPQSPQKDVIINVQPIKEHEMSDIFLVVLDASGRTNFKALTQNIQNFYFVHAQDETKAKEMVLYSFMRSQRRPPDQLINEIQAALKATRLSAILRNMNEQNNFWTYVPFGRRPGAGQQIAPPDPSKLVQHTDPMQPDATSARAYVPSAPAGGVEITPEDLRGVQFSAQDGAVMNKLKAAANGGKPVAPLPEEAPPLNPENDLVVSQMQEQNRKLMEANMQMMQKMNEMMAAMTPPKRRGRKPASEEAGGEEQPGT
jgi:hypothetical protein